jgi:hypothetical protein
MINKLFSLTGFGILLIINFAVYAQTDYQDVIYLKNGGIIRGMIIEQIPNKTLKIETVDRNVFVFQIDEIEKITREPTVNRSSSGSGANKEFLSPGYQGTIELGYAIGVGKTELDFLKLNVINGYRANSHFFIGFGTGFRHYSGLNSFFIPLFIDFRANFSSNSTSPYIAFNLGYSLNASKDFEGVGLLMSPTFGVIFQKDKTPIHLSLGYEMQKMKIQYYNFNWYGYFNSYQVNTSLNAISINVGVSF